MCRKLFLLTSFILVLGLVVPNVVLADVIEVRIAASEDDAEERVVSGSIDLISSDLEITEEDNTKANQLVGMRFSNIAIPQGAIITSAYVQFQVDETDVPDDNRPGTKFLKGEAVDDAVSFTNASFDISSRPTTAAEANWDWPEWLTVNEEGPDQQTSDIAAVIQEIVDRPGWASGNSLVLMITGSGENVAESFDGEPEAAPLLNIEYFIEASNPGTDSAALPEGWQSRDIGTTGGSAAEIDGIWFISGNGEDIWYKSDQFHYAYTRLSGNGTIIARVLDNDIGSDSWAKGGVMIRETLNQNSKYAIMAITGGEGGGRAFQHRPITGQPSLSAHGGDQVYPPMWIKLTRAGHTFTGYYSVNGVNWIEQENWSLDGDDAARNPATIEMATDVYIGLFVTSHRSGEVRTYTFDNVELSEIPSSAGADIILVTEAIDWDMDGLRDDHGLESFLFSEGYNLDVRPDYWKMLTPDKIAELNAADLIIFSRLAWSDHYDEGNETSDWNSLTTPLLQMNAYFARNTRWKWVNSRGGTPDDTPLIYMEIVDPLHPIFIDMLLSSYDPDGQANVVKMIDPIVGTGLTSFIGSTDMGNGHLIAKPAQLGMGWIAEWDADVEFFDGSGQYSGGKRMLFCAGTQEIQYYDYDRQEVITTAQGELNLTAEGLQMFRNAIDYLLKREFTPDFTESIVEDFETEDFSKFPWSSYGDESWEITRSERHSGYYSARSGTIEDGEETSLEVSIDCVWGYITFYCKVSSESDFDELTFYIDGVEQGKWSGEEDWAEVSFLVRDGTRTFKWAYSKDSSVSEGDDSAWIDDIVFPIGP